MRTQLRQPKPLRERAGEGDGEPRLLGASASISLREALRAQCHRLAGRSVLVAASDQTASARAILALDGVAKRIVLRPPGVPAEYFPAIVDAGGVDAVISDEDVQGFEAAEERPSVETSWVLMTSGTTGAPKLIEHTLASLTAPIDTQKARASQAVWGTFYDIRRYGGLQIFLRAVLGGASLVLSSAGEPVADHLARLAASGVTHLTGTPSHWRRALMSPNIGLIRPRYVRLSGEIADQAILNALRAAFPDAAIGHAFASTEAGVGFEVDDEQAGFPLAYLGGRNGVEMKIEDGSLRLRSSRTAIRYLTNDGPLADAAGFVDTGDMIDVRNGRCYFLGRRNGVINVGGLKVYPEEVEAVINRHPNVRMSMVRPRRNPFTGAVVSADVVLREPVENLQAEIGALCRQSLAPHKVPVSIRAVPSLDVAAAGKMVRPHA